MVSPCKPPVIRVIQVSPEAQLFLNQTTIFTLSRGVRQYVIALKWLETTHLRFDKNNFEIRP